MGWLPDLAKGKSGRHPKKLKNHNCILDAVPLSAGKHPDPKEWEVVPTSLGNLPIYPAKSYSYFIKNQMTLTKKHKKLIQNRLENIIEKIKKEIRNDQVFPSDEEISGWFSEMLPDHITQNNAAQFWKSKRAKKLEALFFVEEEMIYLMVHYRPEFYKQPYIYFHSEIIFINDLDPADFIRIEKIMKNLRKKFTLY